MIEYLMCQFQQEQTFLLGLSQRSEEIEFQLGTSRPPYIRVLEARRSLCYGFSNHILLRQVPLCPCVRRVITPASLQAFQDEDGREDCLLKSKSSSAGMSQNPDIRQMNHHPKCCYASKVNHIFYCVYNKYTKASSKANNSKSILHRPPHTVSGCKAL